MRLLILGGTRFVGRHLAAASLERGWDVTLFHRGQSNPDLFPEAEHRIGDRDGDLSALASGEWDAVVDTCGYVPRIVRASVESLCERVGRYVFVSSASVYADKSKFGITEDAPLAGLSDPGSEDVETHYDGLKAMCEHVVTEVMGRRSVTVRPGLIVGPHDPTNRFTYWVTTIASGGDVVAPEPRDQRAQVIDGRDLAAFMLALIEQGRDGPFNAVGDVSSMEEVLRTVAAATGSDAVLRWTPEERLIADGVEPWTDLPLWLAPETDPEYRGFLAISNARAKEAGLTLRPLEETVRDTLAWERGG